MDFLKKYNALFLTSIDSVIKRKEPVQLYNPMEYILSLGGKRLRPILTLMVADFFEADTKKALPAALSVELFHNFSLIHDDIMDDAPLRRGKETIHTKWNVNTGILSGDAMLILAYQLFESYEADLFKELAKLFSKTAIEVCEGQQYDIDFETIEDVSSVEYLKMIENKTAVLIGAAMKMGAIVAEASESCKEAVYQFGKNLGIAFQLQDDYLDVFGNPDSFGKQVGGDILANKKTYLYIQALKQGSPSEIESLKRYYSQSPKDPSLKIKDVKQIFKNSGAAKSTLAKIESYTQKANEALELISISESNKNKLREVGIWLMGRTT